MKPSALVATALTVSLLSIAGCSEDPEPEIASPTAAPSPLQSSTAPTESAAPELPDSADQKSRAGAEAFIAYFWDVVNFSQSTGSADLIRDLGTQSCVGCEAAAKFVENIVSSGVEPEGGEYTVDNIESRRLFVQGQYLVRVDFDIRNEPLIIDAPGKRDDQVLDAIDGRGQFTLNWIDGEWRVGTWDGRL